MFKLKTSAILAASISLSACNQTSLTQSDVDKAKQRASLIGLTISPNLKTPPNGPNPNPPRGKEIPARSVNAAWNADRDAVRACVIQYDQLLGEVLIIENEIRKMTGGESQVQSSAPKKN